MEKSPGDETQPERKYNTAGRGRGRANPRSGGLGAVAPLGNAAAAGGPAQSRPPVVPVAQQKRAVVDPNNASALQERANGEGGAKSTAAVAEQTRGTVRNKHVINEILPTRPQDCATKGGSTGTRVVVQANYFRLLKTPQWTIYQYRVDFNPIVDAIRLRHVYLSRHKTVLGGYIFDGTIFFTVNNLKDKMVDGVLELKSVGRGEEEVLIKIRHVGIVEASDNQHLQVLNLILRRAMEGLKLQLLGRHFFDPLTKVAIDAFRLEVWPGYTTSIRQHEQDILLCGEITHRVMRTESVYTILCECIRGNNEDYQHAFKRQVIGIIVLTDYNNKTYRVDDVDFQASPLSTFDSKNGKVSYTTYYKERYNLVIKDKKQPLLVSRPTEKNIRTGVKEMIMLIPELARPTGMTDDMRANFKLMKALSEHTRLSPEIRIQRLRSFNKRLQSSKESTEVLKSWNMTLDTRLVEIPARILPKERIVFGNQHRYMCDSRADWTRELRGATMYSHIDIKRWYVIVPKRHLPQVQDFIQMCIKSAAGMKMHISTPRYQELPDDRNGTYSQSIEVSAAKDPQIMMLVLANVNEEKYSCIKKKCCVDRPVPSQVVTLKTIAPRGDKGMSGLMSIATKVVIQMNAKLMGAPWMVELPVRGLMTVGFDVCHSAKDKNKSFGALVASMDMRASTHYYSAVSAHLKTQEMSNEIVLKMSYALKAYRAEHNCLPQRILFYRDGVGDGQLHQVFHTEVNHLKNELDTIYKDAGVDEGCRIAFIVVSKRINTRYFSNGQNPESGTVVDDIITLPERYDFFLVSQAVRVGAVAPTSYNVVFDTMGLNADKIQMLTYKMTHMYYNWAGTVRVPAVCQYAHKLAYLVAENINRCPHTSLENQLYFL